MPNQLSPIVEQRIVAFALGHPGLGPKRIAARLARPEWGGLQISPDGVYKTLRRHGLNTRAKRLALVAGYRAPFEPPRDPQPAPHVDSERPGELVGIDCFFVGRLHGTKDRSGRSRVWRPIGATTARRRRLCRGSAAHQPRHPAVMHLTASTTTAHDRRPPPEGTRRAPTRSTLRPSQRRLGECPNPCKATAATRLALPLPAPDREPSHRAWREAGGRSISGTRRRGSRRAGRCSPCRRAGSPHFVNRLDATAGITPGDVRPRDGAAPRGPSAAVGHRGAGASHSRTSTGTLRQRLPVRR